MKKIFLLFVAGAFIIACDKEMTTDPVQMAQETELAAVSQGELITLGPERDSSTGKWSVIRLVIEIEGEDALIYGQSDGINNWFFGVATKGSCSDLGILKGNQPGDNKTFISLTKSKHNPFYRNYENFFLFGSFGQMYTDGIVLACDQRVGHPVKNSDATLVDMVRLENGSLDYYFSSQRAADNAAAAEKAAASTSAKSESDGPVTISAPTPLSIPTLGTAEVRPIFGGVMADNIDSWVVHREDELIFSSIIHDGDSFDVFRDLEDSMVTYRIDVLIDDAIVATKNIIVQGSDIVVHQFIDHVDFETVIHADDTYDGTLAGEPAEEHSVFDTADWIENAEVAFQVGETTTDLTSTTFEVAFTPEVTETTNIKASISSDGTPDTTIEIVERAPIPNQFYSDDFGDHTQLDSRVTFAWAWVPLSDSNGFAFNVDGFTLEDHDQNQIFIYDDAYIDGNGDPVDKIRMAWNGLRGSGYTDGGTVVVNGIIDWHAPNKKTIVERINEAVAAAYEKTKDVSDWVTQNPATSILEQVTIEKFDQVMTTTYINGDTTTEEQTIDNPEYEPLFGEISNLNSSLSFHSFERNDVLGKRRVHYRFRYQDGEKEFSITVFDGAISGVSAATVIEAANIEYSKL